MKAASHLDLINGSTEGICEGVEETVHGEGHQTMADAPLQLGVITGDVEGARGTAAEQTESVNELPIPERRPAPPKRYHQLLPTFILPFVSKVRTGIILLQRRQITGFGSIMLHVK